MSLAAIEFNMELHIAGFDVACMWDNGDGDIWLDGRRRCGNCGANSSDHMLTSPMTDDGSGRFLPMDEWRLNPMHHGMEMMSRAQNQSMLRVTPDGRLHGFASRNETSGRVMLWLINKWDGAEMRVRLQLPPGVIAPSHVSSLVDDADASVPGSQRWGTVTAPKELPCVAGVCEFVLPPLSVSMLADAATLAPMSRDSVHEDE